MHVEKPVEQRPNSDEDLTWSCRIMKSKILGKCVLFKNDAERTSIGDLILYFSMDLIQFRFLSQDV